MRERIIWRYVCRIHSFLFESNLDYNFIDCNDVRFQSARDIYVRTYTLQAVHRLYVQQCGVLYRRYMPS